MVFFQGMAIMIEQPAVALIPLAILLALYFKSRRRFVLIAALGWACYLPYELGMQYRVLCSGECNIRIDLLLIYPALLLWSLAALIIGIRVVSRRP